MLWENVLHCLTESGWDIPMYLVPDPSTDFTTIPINDNIIRNWIVTEQKWNSMSWNPWTVKAITNGVAEFIEIPAQSEQSEKPEWAQIFIIYPIWLVNRCISSINKEETKRICKAYISDQDVEQTVEQEMLYRLRASTVDLTPKNTERGRLHTKATLLKTWTKETTRTIVELEAFDSTLYTHWR